MISFVVLLEKPENAVFKSMTPVTASASMQIMPVRPNDIFLTINDTAMNTSTARVMISCVFIFCCLLPCTIRKLHRNDFESRPDSNRLLFTHAYPAPLIVPSYA